ncbi:MAG: hypothetical protein ACJ8R9_25640 [Steroidobacteraceae bacterium]
MFAQRDRLRLQRITIVATIPAGALNADTTVTIETGSTRTPDLTGTLSANGNIYSVKFSNCAVLGQPMMLKTTAAAAPQHSKLGDIAELQNGAWVPAGRQFLSWFGHLGRGFDR